MSYRTSRHEMQMSLVECVIEAPSDSISSTATTRSRSSSHSSSSISDDVSVSSTYTESDGDTPVIDVSHSSSSSSSPVCARRESQSRRQPTCQSSLSHAHMTRPLTGTYQQSRASKISPQNAGTHPNVEFRRNPSPTIEITVDCEERSYGQRKSLNTSLRQGGRRTNNHRSVPVNWNSDSSRTRRGRDDCSLAQKCRDDERLAEKYNELRQLLLNRLNLQTLTPQIRRQARQLIQRYYQGSTSTSPGKYSGKYRQTMMLGTASSDSRSRATQSADTKTRSRHDRHLIGVKSNTASWENDAQLHQNHGEVSRDRKTVTFLDDYMQHDSRHDVEHPTNEDKDTTTSQYRHQQQHTTEAKSHHSSDDDDSYSTNFSSESTSDNEPWQPHQQSSTTQKPSQLAVSSDRRGKKKALDGTSGRNMQQQSRLFSAGSKETVTTTLNSSCAEKPAKTTTETSQKKRSPTRSQTRRKLERLVPNSATWVSSRNLKDKKVDRNASPNRSRARRRKVQGTGPQPENNPDKSNEDGDKKSSRSSSPSSTSSASRSKSKSPSRERKFRSPDRVLSQTLHEYHLKYTENVDIRQWLKSKNSELRCQKKKKKRLERDRRRELQEQQQAREERRKESEVVVQRWMEEKRLESKMMSRSQKQCTKTAEHPERDVKPSKDQDGLNNPDSQQGQNGSVSKPIRSQDGKALFPIKDGNSKVSLGRHGTIPGADVWKTSGKNTPEVSERRKAYGDWLRRSRTGGMATGDEGRLAFLVNNHEDQTEYSPYQSDLHPQGLDKDRRCVSATTGRRKRGGGLIGERSQGGRPGSSRINRIGKRLEPQGSDRFDLDPDPDRSGTSQTREDTTGNTSHGLEVKNVTTPEKYSSSHIVPHVSFEFESERTPSQVEYVENKVSEDDKNTTEASSQRQLGATMRSSRDLMNIIKSSDAKHLPVNPDTTNTGPNKDLENRQCSAANFESPEKVPQEFQEEEKKGHSDEDGQMKPMDTESARRSSNFSITTDDDDDNDVIVGGR